jgi:hypothetical protein
LLACFNSLPVDYITRQKVGGTDIGYFHLDQLPIPRPTDFDEEARSFLKTRVLELSYTAWDLSHFAADLGYDGSPFKWIPERRHRVQCEIDAFFSHLYQLSRNELEFVLDPKQYHGSDYPGETFRVLQEKEVERFGQYRTRATILEFYDAMADAKRAKRRYQSPLSPAAASVEMTHAAKSTNTARKGSVRAFE